MTGPVVVVSGATPDSPPPGIEPAAAPGAKLEITIDIQASKGDGFREGEGRTISENARVLKFDPSSGCELS